MLKTIIYAGLIILLSSTSTLTNAVTISANDLALGTDVTLLGNVGEISVLYETTPQIARIKYEGESGLNIIGSATTNMTNVGEFTDYVVGLVINLTAQIDYFSFKGFDRSYDSFSILFYDADNALINRTHPSQAQTSTSYYDCGISGYLCRQYNYNFQTNFDLSNVRKIYFGGSSAAAYVTEITVRVPEPLPLALLLLGAAGLLARKIKLDKQSLVNA